MNIVHLSTTPLAGSPYSISTALNRYTECNSRHICLESDTYGKRTYPSDLDWAKDKTKCLELLELADIVHCHHVFHTENSPFGNLRKNCSKNVHFIRHYHAAPSAIKKHKPYQEDLDECISEEPLPSLVNAQHPERYFPKSKIVPNIILLDDPVFNKCGNHNTNTITFSPTFGNSAWFTNDPDNRWNTKGAPETTSLLKKITKDYDFDFDLIENSTWKECMLRRKNGILAIDELVTGSYHRSSLECLALGKTTLAFLDDRTQEVIKDISGTNNLPWVNTHLENAYQDIEYLINNKYVLDALGSESQYWMKKYWNPANLINIYLEAYENLNKLGDTLDKQRFDTHKKTMWSVKDKYDLLFKSILARNKPVGKIYN